MTGSDVVRNLLAESGLAGDAELTAVLTGLRGLAAGPPPEPTPELAALLAGDAPASTAVLPAPVVPISRRRRAAAGVGAVVLAAVASTGVAAAANQLPSGAQRLAAQLSTDFLPFSFPPPREDGPLTPGTLGPSDGGRPHHPGGPTGQGTAPPATLAPAATPRDDHPAGRRHGDHDGQRDGRWGHDGHHDDDGLTAADGRDGDGTRRHRDSVDARRRDDGRADERSRRTGDGSGSDGERSGADDGGSGTSGGSGSGGSGGSGGSDGGSGGGSPLPDVTGVLPQ